jgi:hypothetical protein
MTYTYAILDIPATAYAAVRALLKAADYGHAFHAETDGEVIDMHGIALRSKGAQGAKIGTALEVASILSSRTNEGMVEMSLNGEMTQMELDKAREVVGMLQGAIEAAVSDELLYRFLTSRLGIEPRKASAALLDFREMRQGSRETVYPQ